MFEEYFDSRQSIIVESLGKKLAHLRNQYDYPKAFLKKSKTKTNIEITPGFWCDPVEYPKEVKSDIELDSYHRQLLFSESAEDNLLGSSSVIFWGFQTFNQKIALFRVNRHLVGDRGKPGTSPAKIKNVLDSIRKSSSLGEAITKLSPVSQLGRTSFASKLISFMYPEAAGVYDSQICRGLSKFSWAKENNLVFRIDQASVSSPRIQDGYMRWCEFLSQVAEKMNDGISSGRDWSWKDPVAGSQLWRAVDVERALFQFFRKS